ncbi:protein VARIATION IN COMPOUND TRIGGERED ROOT growth response isoform X2 [Brassica rapa]|uniref:protein VARIATION IN COMPOUND TRIGGERED ROOT growth response isoform X2 n=1 Tax=Brassica campestris TaxID=3711 RepID=UPI0004F16C63|nr:protein VARIATION IN COMPOUND TRIGGERED ROOT growth response isoform X2 [Brassica rapa]
MLLHSSEDQSPSFPSNYFAPLSVLTVSVSMALSLSSSSSSSRTCTYDVFPSFSGEDVRITFLSHFLKELDKRLIIAFKDNETQRSLSLGPELKQAIRDSRIAVVIFSNKYASSSWCLNELLEIVKCREECGQMVIPVFYRLDPSHVRKQTGDFGNIFEETCKNKTEEVIIQWRRALTDVANTLGYHSVNWDSEAKMIEEIVSDVSDKLLLTPSEDSENFVGIEDHIAEMSVLLQLESEEVRMVGIWGCSGIGKTTIARVLFNRLSRHFQGRIFIDRAFLSKSMDIYSQANPYDYNLKLHLQSEFLSKILGKKDIEISQLGELAGRLKHHKVLVFIDDLNDQVVLDSLVGQTQWFGSGSRIIVVTNDKHFLRAHGIEHIYEVCLPSEDVAREILCRSAFREKSPPEGFEELVYEITRLVGSPLGLTVLGSSLRGRDNEYWMDSLSMLQTGKNGKIEKISRISYDGLSSEEDKTIFRYIACYFNGGKVAYMKLLLADSGLSVNVGLENLADKSLIHVREGRVEMHGLLKKMGKKVVRLEKPENREFLEDSQDIFDVLTKGIGTEKVLSISLNISTIEELHVHENAFKRMRNLRFLKVLGSDESGTMKLRIPKSFDYSKLKLLRWRDYPMRCLPSKFRPENLVELKMQNSKLEKLWEGVVALPYLKEMDLRYSHDLMQMPDLSKATNLEILNLSQCYSLVKLPSSIPHPNKLRKLNMRDCRNVETIPIGISLKSLEKLDLDGCSRLRTLPQISTNIVHLCLSETAIEEFPSDLHLENLRFEKLSYLSMQNLKSKKLWEKVQPLIFLTGIMSPSMRQLYLSDIPSLVELPSSFQNLHQLEKLKIENCVNLETLPTGINLQSLEELDLSGCSKLRTFPDISTNIQTLNLNETEIEEVPCWIEKFSRLEVLYMNDCINLETLPTGINLQTLSFLYLNGCSRLRTFPGISTNIVCLYLSETAIEEVPWWIEKFSRLRVLYMNGCINLETVLDLDHRYLDILNLSGCSKLRTFPNISTNIRRLNLSETGIEEVPCWIGKFFFCLLKLKMSGCSKLRTFPNISTNIVRLNLNETAIEEVPCWIEKFSKLEILKMKGCINLETLPTGINLQSLRELNLSGCSRLRTFPDISTNIQWLYLSETAIEEVPCWIEKFTRLEELEMNGCNKLKSVSLNISKLGDPYLVDFSDCKVMTGGSWSFSGGCTTFANFTNCLNLDQEALFRQNTHLGCRLCLSGEEVPSYFTHRTTVTSSSSSLTVRLLPSSLSNPFLRFRACIVLNEDNSAWVTSFGFKGRFWNSFDSFGQAQYFQKPKKISSMKKSVKGSYLLILECSIQAEMNYTHVDLQLDFAYCEYKVKEWGIRLCSSADNQLGYPNTLPHVFQTGEGNTLNEAGQGKKSGGEDEVTESSSKRMRIS